MDEEKRRKRRGRKETERKRDGMRKKEKEARGFSCEPLFSTGLSSH